MKLRITLQPYQGLITTLKTHLIGLAVIEEAKISNRHGLSS